MKLRIHNILEAAKKELLEEQFRERVEEEKLRIKTKIKFWHRVFPWEISIKRRGK